VNEKILQLAWKHQWGDWLALRTVTGEPIQVIHRGQLNLGQGPDFLYARIRMGQTIWSGHIEMHVRSSDWWKHQHDDDPFFHNVILHVVWEHDAATLPADLPILEIRSFISRTALQGWFQQKDHRPTIPCAGQLHQVDATIWAEWKQEMLRVRFEQKAEAVRLFALQAAGNWGQVFWRLMFRCFGGYANADAFEHLFLQLTWTSLIRHANRLVVLEAILLGAAGLLQKSLTVEDDYYRLLQREFRNWATRHAWTSSDLRVRFLRMRPAGFPTVRLALLASLMHQYPNLHQEASVDSEHAFNQIMLHIVANDYWHYHYQFGIESPFEEKRIGKHLIEQIHLNVLLPIWLARHAAANGNIKKMMVKAENLQVENHAITRLWKSLGVRVSHAGDSQALLHLYRNFCVQKKCLECRVGQTCLSNPTPPMV
jgi:hypothetical protein